MLDREQTVDPIRHDELCWPYYTVRPVVHDDIVFFKDYVETVARRIGSGTMLHFRARYDQPEVLDAVRRWARDDLRSVNAQVEFLLRRALQREGRLPKSRGKRGTEA